MLTSLLTTEAVQVKKILEQSIPVGKSIIINVDYFAISATGKRISGKIRAVFTNVAGTLVQLDVKKDPYLVQDAAGFADDSITFQITGSTIAVKTAGYAGQGDTNWTLNLDNYIA